VARSRNVRASADSARRVEQHEKERRYRAARAVLQNFRNSGACHSIRKTRKYPYRIPSPLLLPGIPLDKSRADPTARSVAVCNGTPWNLLFRETASRSTRVSREREREREMCVLSARRFNLRSFKSTVNDVALGSSTDARWRAALRFRTLTSLFPTLFSA